MSNDDVTERAAKWIVARAIHEHDANASMSGEPWPTWNELYVEGREAYAYVGEAVAQALDAAGLLATPKHDAAVAAEALREARDEMSRWEGWDTRDIGHAFLSESVLDALDDAADRIEQAD